MKIINIENVSFWYDEASDKKALDGVSVSIEEGSFVAVLGHNGSGKSTLARHLNALLTPKSGNVIVLGADTKDEEKTLFIRENVGVVFQNPDNQIVGTVVEDDVAFAPENLGVPNPMLRQRVDEALRAVSMDKYARVSPHELSGGQKQRVAIAGIIAMNPRCVVFDESTAMLDPKGRKEVMSVARKLCREKGITVIMITHYMEEAAEADRIVVVDRGKVVIDGTPKEVFVQYEKLREIGLDVPQSTYLSYLLKDTECAIPLDVLTAEECASAIYQMLKKKGKV